MTTTKQTTGAARDAGQLTVETYTAPSSWASYLINGDNSGIDDTEQEAADKFVAWVGASGPVGCENAGFRSRHDAYQFQPLAGDCQTYSFLRRTKTAVAGAGRMTPTEHEKNEWSRLAKSAYAAAQNDIGHRFSEAAACRIGESMTLAQFDALQTDYRNWLIGSYGRMTGYRDTLIWSHSLPEKMTSPLSYQIETEHNDGGFSYRVLLHGAELVIEHDFTTRASALEDARSFCRIHSLT